MEIEIQQFLNGLDHLFATGQGQKAGIYLEEWLAKAEEASDINGTFTVLNEMMGYYRSTEQEEKGISAATKCVMLIGQYGLQNHPAVGTMFLNIATTLCHFKRVEEAIDFYKRAEKSFSTYGANHFTMASLYNNMAFSYVQKEEYYEAENSYKNALNLLEKVDGSNGEKAVTYANMIDLYKKSGQKEKAMDCVKKIQLSLKEENNIMDAKYASACLKCANILKAYSWLEEARKLEERGNRIYEGT